MSSGRAASAERCEEVNEDEERRQAESRHGHDQHRKCIAGEDYSAAAAVDDNIVSLKGLSGRLKVGVAARRFEKADDIDGGEASGTSASFP